MCLMRVQRGSNWRESTGFPTVLIERLRVSDSLVGTPESRHTAARGARRIARPRLRAIPASQIQRQRSRARRAARPRARRDQAGAVIGDQDHAIRAKRIYILTRRYETAPPGPRQRKVYKCKYKYTEVSCTTQTLTLCTRAHTFNPTSGSRLAHLGFAARARVRASARVGDNLERHGEAHLLVQLQLGGGRADTLDRRHGDLLAVHDHAWMARWSGSGPASGLDEIRTSRIRDRVRGGHWGRLLSP